MACHLFHLKGVIQVKDQKVVITLHKGTLKERDLPFKILDHAAVFRYLRKTVSAELVFEHEKLLENQGVLKVRDIRPAMPDYLDLKENSFARYKGVTTCK